MRMATSDIPEQVKTIWTNPRKKYKPKNNLKFWTLKTMHSIGYNDPSMTNDRYHLMVMS